jgi:sulfonate transport system substrate-binding protein
VRRREVLKWGVLGVGAMLTAACGGAATPTATTAPKPASSSAPAPTGAPAAQAKPAGGGGKPTEIRVDWATYSPPSLALKKFQWLEESLKPDGITVKWVQSAGSNKALEFLGSDSIDFGSTAGSAALLAKANDTPIKAVYIYEKPEWTALVAPANSPIKAVADLKGKKVAATKGTDPFFFLLRSLRTAGLTRNDIEHVNLQHADGKLALDRGQVDAWSGLDPLMAQAELESKARLFYRNADFNTYGFLNAREDFVNKYPDYVKKVLQAYEKARLWTIEKPEEAADLLAAEAQITKEVAKKELVERMDFKSGTTPGDKHAEMLKAVVEIAKAEDLLKPGADGEKAIRELLESRFAV